MSEKSKEQKLKEIFDGVKEEIEKKECECKKSDMLEYEIKTTTGSIRITGKYRRDLETEHWHFYEDERGTIYHFRKEHMVAVFGGTEEIIMESRLEN